MSDFIGLAYIFLQKYLVPFMFAVGLMYFIYGFIEYFIAGRKGGDEERAQKGRLFLLKSCSWFFMALVVYSVVAFFGWLATQSLNNLDSNNDSDGNFGVDLDNGRGSLSVPDVPRRNEDD
jgi:hypothetical protein